MLHHYSCFSQRKYKIRSFWYPITKLEIHHFVKSKHPMIKGNNQIGLDRNGVPVEHLTAPERLCSGPKWTQGVQNCLHSNSHINQGCHYNLRYIRITWVLSCINALGGVEEAVEGIVGRLQIKQHLAYLTVIQLVWGRHAAEGGQPGRINRREMTGQ